MAVNGDEGSERIGRTVAGRYRPIRVLGRGGYSFVYEAENLWTGRRVALKMLRTAFITDPEIERRFLAEARAVAQISHPNIVDVLDMGEDPQDGALYMVLELLIGEDLRALLSRDGPMHPRAALDIALPLMGALVALHERGVIHRDIKPANVFLAQTATGERAPTLIDFGISKLLDGASGDERTRTGMVMGTVQYMSPEQARGESSLDARADVWSMGALLYELLAGVSPFDAPSVADVLTRILTQPPRPLDEVAPAVSRPLAQVIHRALEGDRTARLDSMQAFIDALGACPTLVAVTLDERGYDVDDVATDVFVGPKGTLPIPLTAARPPSIAPVAPPSPPEVAPPSPPEVAPPSPPEVAPPPPPPSPTRRAAMVAAVGVASIVALGAGAAHTARGARPAASYRVSMRVRPPGAQIALDGDAPRIGGLDREFALDGRPHIVEIRAPGHYPKTLRFLDAPPPREVTLVSVEAP